MNSSTSSAAGLDYYLGEGSPNQRGLPGAFTLTGEILSSGAIRGFPSHPEDAARVVGLIAP